MFYDSSWDRPIILYSPDKINFYFSLSVYLNGYILLTRIKLKTPKCSKVNPTLTEFRYVTKKLHFYSKVHSIQMH